MKKLLLLAAVLCAAFQLHAQDDQAAKVDTNVTSHLTSYFKTHSIIGIPSSARAKTVDVTITDTQVVQGWTGRYIVTGTATIVTADKHAPNYACDFEVTAEINEHGVVKIIDTKYTKLPSV